MSDENVNKEPKAPVLGILSTICGGASLAPFLGIISPIGLVLGIIGLKVDRKKTLSIIGTTLSVIGLATSPVLWCLSGIVDCDKGSEKGQEILDKAQKKAEEKKALETLPQSSEL